MPVTGLPFVLVSSAVQTQAGRGFSAVPTGQVHTLPASLTVDNGVLVLRHRNYLESISPERPNARVRRGQSGVDKFGLRYTPYGWALVHPPYPIYGATVVGQVAQPARVFLRGST